MLCNVVSHPKYVKILIENEDILRPLISHVESQTTIGVFYSIKALRLLSKQEESLEKLQSEDLRLSRLLIRSYQVLAAKNMNKGIIKNTS